MRRGIPTLIIESRTLLREGLISLLHASNFRVVASAATLDELEPLKLESPGVLIVGSTGAADDLPLLEKLSRTWPDCTIVAIADEDGHSARNDIPRVLRGGAGAYILNVQSRDVLLKALELALLKQRLVVVGSTPDKSPVSQPNGGSEVTGSAPARLDGNGAAHPALSGDEVGSRHR